MSFKVKKELLRAGNTSECFYLIYILLYYTGCLGCKIKNKKELYYEKNYNIYRKIYRLIYLTGFIGALLYKACDAELSKAIMSRLLPVLKIILISECITCPVIYMKVILNMDSHSDKYINLANTLQTIDEQMKHNFRNIQWNYQKTARKYNSMIVILYVLYVIASTIFIFKIADNSSGWISSTIISICYTCITSSPVFAEFLFVGKMDVLRLRFRLVRNLLRQSTLSTYRTSYSFNHNEYITKIKLLQNYFMQYSSLIVPLNQVFSVTTGLALFHDFALLTSLGYLLCSKAFDKQTKVLEYVIISLFMAPRIYKAVSTAVHGYATQKERKNCFQEFIKIGYNFKKSDLMQDHMETFLHWRMHNTTCFTVGKILNCNLNLIFWSLNSIVNYIVILMQLHFQQTNIVKMNNELAIKQG